MTMAEAQSLGYKFTGCTWDSCLDTKEVIVNCKKEAKEIKDTFEGADYVICRGRKKDWLGSSNVYAVMGNKIFVKVRYEFIYNEVSNRVSSYDKKINDLTNIYQHELEKLKKDKLDDEKLLEEINSLRKDK